jgi:hypothetical protein
MFTGQGGILHQQVNGPRRQDISQPEMALTGYSRQSARDCRRSRGSNSVGSSRGAAAFWVGEVVRSMRGRPVV